MMAMGVPADTHAGSGGWPDPAGLRALVAQALRDGHLAEGLGGFALQDWMTLARREGVLALLEWRLRTNGGWDALPGEFRDAAATGVRQAAAQWLVRKRELQRLDGALAEHGLRCLLLKGNALAFWLYPQPYLRDSGDIDLLLASLAETRHVADVASTLGYRLAFLPHSMNYEMTSRLEVGGVQRSELDLHCRLLNSVLYADVLDFETLWDESLAVPEMAVLRMPSPRHALMHACMNRALDIQNGIPDRLKLLYDIRMLAERMDTQAWDDLAAQAGKRKISGICLRTLVDASDTVGAHLPSGQLARLRAQAEVEPVDYRRLQDWQYMQWRNLRALPGMRLKGRWLWQRLFPSRKHLQELYGGANRWKQLTRRAGRLLRRLFGD